MQATVPGMNRTGAAVSPEGTQAMTRAANELTPPMQIDTAASEAQRIVYINEAAAVGSIPPPPHSRALSKPASPSSRGATPASFWTSWASALPMSVAACGCMRRSSRSTKP